MLEVFVLSGPDTGRSAKLAAGDLIGRAEGCALRLGDRSISRRHARVEDRSGQLVLVDAGSTNGLSLGGERVAEIELADFLEFHAGEVELRVRLGAEKSPAAPAPATQPARPAAAPAEEPTFSFGGGVASTPVVEAEIELELEWGEDEPAPARAPANVREAQRAALLGDLNATKESTWLQGDLTQYPAWIQALVGICVLLLGAGLFYGVYALVIGSRSGG